MIKHCAELFWINQKASFILRIHKRLNSYVCSCPILGDKSVSYLIYFLKKTRSISIFLSSERLQSGLFLDPIRFLRHRMRENENTGRNGKGFDQQLFILTAQCLALVAAFIFLKSLRGDIFLLLLLTAT